MARPVFVLTKYEKGKGGVFKKGSSTVEDVAEAQEYKTKGRAKNVGDKLGMRVATHWRSD